jgi:hypothetical protein
MSSTVLAAIAGNLMQGLKMGESLSQRTIEVPAEDAEKSPGATTAQ